MLVLMLLFFGEEVSWVRLVRVREVLDHRGHRQSH